MRYGAGRFDRGQFLALWFGVPGSLKLIDSGIVCGREERGYMFASRAALLAFQGVLAMWCACFWLLMLAHMLMLLILLLS